MAEKVEGPDLECLKDLPNYLQYTGKNLLEGAYELNWGDLSNDCVMDVGCGVDSLTLFKTLFPKFKKVIALDISTSYINYLKFYDAHLGMEYHVGDITDRSTLSQWQGQISKIVSMYCFNCIKDQKAGFENIKYLLKPGGEAIIVTAIKNPHYECAKYMFEKEKYKMYKPLLSEFPDFKAHGDGGLDYYKGLLKDIDFEILSSEELFKFLPFSTEQNFKESVYTQDKVIAERLPREFQDEFKKDYVDAMIELNERAPNGELCLWTSIAKMLIRKKEA